MIKVYCNKCGKDITNPDSDELREEITDGVISRIAAECKYDVPSVSIVKGLGEYPNDNGKYLRAYHCDLCVDCRIKLNKLVGEFMDGTPVSTPA